MIVKQALNDVECRYLHTNNNIEIIRIIQLSELCL